MAASAALPPAEPGRTHSPTRYFYINFIEEYMLIADKVKVQIQQRD